MVMVNSACCALNSGSQLSKYGNISGIAVSYMTYLP
jgi:hypothetical protein